MMKLKTIEIFDYRSIEHEILELNGYQHCFVGKNESGKSSIIQAVSHLDFLGTELTNTLINKGSKRYPNGFPVISGVFQLLPEPYKRLSTLLKKYSEESNAKVLPIESESSFLQVKRWGNGISNISILLSDKENFSFDILKSVKNSAEFIDSFQKEIYPVIEYYEKEDLLIKPATIDDLKGSDQQFETFRRLLFLGGCDDFDILNHPDDNFVSTFTSQIEDKLNAVIKRHYKQDESIQIQLRTIRDNKLNLVIKDNTGQSFSIDERSPGFRYYFSFLVNKLYSKKINGAKNSILLLDEPGANLYPQGAKDLLKTFDEIAESTQILYTTHNPFLTIRNCVDSLIYVTKSPTKGTKVNRKSFLNKYQILRKELGIILNDSFLIGDMNLVVEGATEKLAFHRLFQLDEYQELQWLNIYDAGGVSNISQAINYLGKNNLDLAGIVFMDSDKEAEDEKKKKAYGKSLAEKKWEALEVNDVFKDKLNRTFEDLFPQQLYVSAFNEYCHGLKDLEVFDKPYIDYEFSDAIDTPIIKKLSDHFFLFINEENRKKNSITKQDVIRILLDNIDEKDESERKTALKNILAVLDKIKTTFKKLEKYVSN